MGSSDDSFCLKWNDFHTSVTASFADLRREADLFDVTLVCGDQSIMAHRLILSACSGVFKRMLRLAGHARDPTILMWDMRPDDLECLLNFMYHGEVNVTQEKLNHFLDLAERLQVRGLTSGGDKPNKKQMAQQHTATHHPQRQVNSQPKPGSIVLPTTPVPPSLAAASVALPGGSGPLSKKPKLSLASAINTTPATKEESINIKNEEPSSNQSGAGASCGASDEEEDDDEDFPMAPPVVTEINTLSGSGGGAGAHDDGGVVSDFDSNAFLDNDDGSMGLDERGGLPPLPQFFHDAAGVAGGVAEGLTGAGTNQIDPIVGPDGSKEFPCMYCEKRYLTRSRLKRHVLDVHEKGEFPCPDCSKVFTSSRRLKDHQRSRYCHGQQQNRPGIMGGDSN